MDDSYDHCGMNDDPYAEDSQEEEQQTQTQSTQQASQPETVTVDSHLWGFLQPCSSSLSRIDFWKINPRYTIGRNTETNQVVLPGFKVSTYLTSFRSFDARSALGNVVYCRQHPLRYCLGWE